MIKPIDEDSINYHLNHNVLGPICSTKGLVTLGESEGFSPELVAMMRNRLEAAYSEIALLQAMILTLKEVRK